MAPLANRTEIVDTRASLVPLAGFSLGRLITVVVPNGAAPPRLLGTGNVFGAAAFSAAGLVSRCPAAALFSSVSSVQLGRQDADRQRRSPAELHLRDRTLRGRRLG